ncbi:MAG: fibronectin type III domain-containing protein [Deltaproteobacteria bacterium]|nr:fibronectin type III domain-containing protein [Deltaproteobacteria bacterium]
MKNTIKIFILAVFFLTSAYPAYACVTTLKWDTPTTGGAPTGYNIYYGTASGTVKANYPNKVDAGNVTQYSLKNFSFTANTTYYFRISAYNSIGESEQLSNEISYYSDGIAPSIVITSPTSSSTYTTNSGTITISGTAGDNDEVSTVIWMLSSSSSSGTASGTTSWSVSNIPLVPGNNAFTVTATDCSGKTATDTLTITYAVEETTTPEETVIETDTQAPAIAVVSPASSGTYATTSGTVSLSGTAGDNVGVSTVTWANAANQTSGTASGTTSWSISQISLQEGTNTIAVAATDSAGNTSSAIITVTYTAEEPAAPIEEEPVVKSVSVDNTDPAVTITSPTSGRYFRIRSSAVNLAGSASDNVGVTTVIWANKATGAAGTATGTATWSIPGIELSIGRNIITITAYDEAGNSSSDQILVTRRR